MAGTRERETAPHMTITRETAQPPGRRTLGLLPEGWRAVGGGCHYLAAGFLGALRQEQQGADEEAHRADQGLQVRPVRVAHLAGDRVDVGGDGGDAESDRPGW